MRELILWWRAMLLSIELDYAYECLGEGALHPNYDDDGNVIGEYRGRAPIPWPFYRLREIIKETWWALWNNYEPMEPPEDMTTILRHMRMIVTSTTRSAALRSMMDGIAMVKEGATE